MSKERLRVLQLIKEGKITPEEGLELLSTLQNIEKVNKSYEDIEDDAIKDNIRDDIFIGYGFGRHARESEIAKYLRIKKINKDNGKETNIVIPTSVVRFFGSLGKINAQVNHEIIDFDEWWEKQDNGYKGTLITTSTKSGSEIKVELF